MKYQSGDTILILNTNEEGTVIEIIDDQMVLIEVKGLRFPVYQDQIDFPYFKMFFKKDFFENKPQKKYIDDVKKENDNIKQKVGDGVWLSFLPVFDKDIFDDNIVDKLKVYLINQTETAYLFNYNLFFIGNVQFQLSNQLEALSNFYLNDIKFEDLNNAPRFEFEFSLVKEDKMKAPYYEYSLKPKAKQLFKKIEEMQLKEEATFKYEVFNKYPDKIQDEKPEVLTLQKTGFKIYDLSKLRENLEPAKAIVDLHIEKLTDSWKHLSNFEILTIQLKAFEKFYDLAVVHYQPTLTVIHGIGTGKLKNELHDILKNKKEVKSFVNQYNSNYGYGATEIHFSY